MIDVGTSGVRRAAPYWTRRPTAISHRSEFNALQRPAQRLIRTIKKFNEYIRFCLVMLMVTLRNWFTFTGSARLDFVVWLAKNLRP